jgi:hypothetical protein
MAPSLVNVRRTASVAVTGLLAAGVTAALPAVHSSADPPTITQVSPDTVAIGAPRTVTFTTTATYLSAPPPTATITRTATAADKSPETITASSTSVSGNTVTATFNVTLANPGAYDAEVSGPTSSPPSPSTSNSCQSCLTLTSSPTVTSVEPATTGADFSYPKWTIRGTDFAAGPYTQCTAQPCSTTKPNVAIYNGNTLDPDVTLAASSTSTSGTKKLQMSLTIATADVGGQRTVTVTNTDGTSASCSCLHIAPAMTLTSVSPANLPAGSSGQTLVITGSNFPSDVTPEFLRNGTGPTTDVTWTHETVNSSTQITLTGVSVASNAPDGNQDLRLTSLANNFAHQFPNAFAVGGNPPSGPGESAPTTVTASAGDQQAFVQWTPPASSTGDPITGYTGQTLPSGPSVPAPASASSATVGPLTNGQSYQFTVTVTYQSGASHTSVPSNTVVPSGRPDAPTNVHATAGNKSATVTWTAPAVPNGSSVDSYTVTSSPDGIKAVVFAQSGKAPATTATVSGLTNGTSYTFTVVAHNGGGNSADSAPSNSVTPKGNPTLSLLGPKAIDKGASARLHGQLLGSNGKPVAGATVRLQQRHSGAHRFGPLKALKTSKHGRWSLAVKPATTTDYKVKWAGDAGNNRVATGHAVRVRETGRITSPKDGAHVSAGTRTVRGHASSAKGSPVALEERRNGKWVTIARGKMRSHGKVALRAALAAGHAVLRLRVAGERGLVTGYSPRIRVTVS